MQSTKMNLRRVVLTSALMSVSVFVLGCIWMVVLNDAQRGEEILLLGGYCGLQFLFAIPVLRGAFKHIPSPYYHWED